MKTTVTTAHREAAERGVREAALAAADRLREAAAMAGEPRKQVDVPGIPLIGRRNITATEATSQRAESTS